MKVKPALPTYHQLHKPISSDESEEDESFLAGPPNQCKVDSQVPIKEAQSDNSLSITDSDSDFNGQEGSEEEKLSDG